MNGILLRNRVQACVLANFEILAIQSHKSRIALVTCDSLQHVRCGLKVEPRTECLLHLVQVRGHNAELFQILNLFTVQPHNNLFFSLVSQSVDFVFQSTFLKLLISHDCHSFLNAKNFSSKMCSITKHLIIIT